MPAGKIHAAACVVTAAGSGALFYCNKLSNMITTGNVMLGCLLGILVSPDLDIIDKGNYSMVILGKRSHILAKVWRLFWWPYAKISHHRGYSHWPIIGTLLRALYIITAIMIITIILILVGIRVSLNLEPLAPILVGLILADLVHITMDAIF